MSVRLQTRVIAAAVLTFGLAAAPALGADNYVIDTAHTSVSFKVQHSGISWIHGRFNEYSGSVTIDKENAGKSSFAMTIKTDTVDTNNKQRDNHLRSPDFFNAKQFPAITFQSTAVKAVEGGYEVTGDLNMHGVTKPITLTLKGGKEASLGGARRIGFSTEVTLKGKEFGMNRVSGALGEDVHIAVSFQGIAKK